MGVASGCGEQEVGVASGNGWKISVCYDGDFRTRVVCPRLPRVPAHLDGCCGRDSSL